MLVNGKVLYCTFVVYKTVKLKFVDFAKSIRGQSYNVPKHITHQPPTTKLMSLYLSSSWQNMSSFKLVGSKRDHQHDY